MAKFVIFAHPRTGSTSLARVLAESPDVTMALEPFHPDFTKWNPGETNYHSQVKSKKAMLKAIDKLFSKYSAIKVLDYQLPKKLYHELLIRPDVKILFLRRKNLVDAAISNAIGEQTGKWNKYDSEKSYTKFKPLNVEKLTKWMEYVGGLSNYYYSYLKKNRKADFLPLAYEDLFFEDLEKNKKILEKICKFLGILPPPESAIKKFMTPSQAKINYENIYRKIPNYEEVKRKLNG